MKKENNIIPISLRERDFKSFAKKKKSNNEDRKTSMKTPLSFGKYINIKVLSFYSMH